MEWKGAPGFFPEAGTADEPVITFTGPGQVSDLGRPIAPEIRFTIEPIQEGDEMETGTSMDGVQQLQVPAQCAELTDALGKLAAKLDELEGRLERVLQLEPPIVTEKQKLEAQVVLVPLAEELDSFRRKVHRLTQIVDSMITRLEV